MEEKNNKLKTEFEEVACLQLIQTAINSQLCTFLRIFWHGAEMQGNLFLRCASMLDKEASWFVSVKWCQSNEHKGA